MENFSVLVLVPHNLRQAWLCFERPIYERWVKAGHEGAYGNLDYLIQDGYEDDILELTEEGIFPSSDKEDYWPIAYRYPS